jgi:hypothetical protein
MHNTSATLHKSPAPTPAEEPVPAQHPSPDETPVPDHNPTDLKPIPAGEYFTRDTALRLLSMVRYDESPRLGAHASRLRGN